MRLINEDWNSNLVQEYGILAGSNSKSYIFCPSIMWIQHFHVAAWKMCNQKRMKALLLAGLYNVHRLFFQMLYNLTLLFRDTVIASVCWCLQDSLSSFRKNITFHKTLAALWAISWFRYHIFDPHTLSAAILGDHILYLMHLLLSWFPDCSICLGSFSSRNECRGLQQEVWMATIRKKEESSDVLLVLRLEDTN